MIDLYLETHMHEEIEQRICSVQMRSGLFAQMKQLRRFPEFWYWRMTDLLQLTHSHTDYAFLRFFAARKWQPLRLADSHGDLHLTFQVSYLIC